MHHMDEHAEMAMPQTHLPLTWYVDEGMRRVDTLSPGPIEMYEPDPPLKSYRPLLVLMSISAAVVIGSALYWLA